LQRRVADVLDQTQQYRGRFAQLGLAAALGQQVGAGAGDDQFADQIDQLVELVGVHADHARFVGLLLADHGLAAGGSLDDLLVHDFLADENVTERRLRRRRSLDSRRQGLRGEAGVEFGLRQRAGAHEDLAEAHVVLGKFVDQLQVLVDLRVGRQDVQRAVVADEVEDVLDLGLRGARLEAHLETQVAAFGVHLVGRGHGVGEGGDGDDLAERGEVVQEG